jgi:hypothetical protein
MARTDGVASRRFAGIQLSIEGDDLGLEASVAPPPALLDLLSHHKASVIALLRPANDGWSAEDWLAFYDERAAARSRVTSWNG